MKQLKIFQLEQNGNDIYIWIDYKLYNMQSANIDIESGYILMLYANLHFFHQIVHTYIICYLESQTGRYS